MTGGVIHCNHDGEESNSTVFAGIYSVNRDGTGYMTVATTIASIAVCNVDKGVDLTFSVVSGGTKILFATDGSANFWVTGEIIPFAGEADRL